MADMIFTPSYALHSALKEVLNENAKLKKYLEEPKDFEFDAATVRDDGVLVLLKNTGYGYYFEIETFLTRWWLFEGTPSKRQFSGSFGTLQEAVNVGKAYT